MAPGNRRGKRVWLLLVEEDIRLLGNEIIVARPSVRFRADGSSQVWRTMPEDARRTVDMADALLAPGYDLPEPDLRLDPNGIGIRLILPRIFDDEMDAGEINTLYRPDDAGHVAFVDAVFGAVGRVTKPHVLKMSGERANVRIGPVAAEWWRADDRRQLRHESSNSVFYMLPGERRRVTLRDAD